MLRSRIPHIPVPSVPGIFFCNPTHIFVSPRLGENRSRRNRRETPVSSDESPPFHILPQRDIFLQHTAVKVFFKRGLRKTVNRPESVPVNDQRLRFQTQAYRRPPHSDNRRVEYVDFVNLLRAHALHSPGEGLPLNYRPQFVPLPFAHLFRVVQQRMPEVRGQNHRCGEDRPGKRTSSRFVATGFHQIRVSPNRQAFPIHLLWISIGVHPSAPDRFATANQS